MDIAYGILAFSANRVERIIGGIGVARDEIDRQLVCSTKLQEFCHPNGLPLLVIDMFLVIEHRLRVVEYLPIVSVVGDEVASGWAAYAQLRVDSLDGFGRGFVELEIITAGAFEESCLWCHVQVGLVPYLKIPLAHLVKPITLNNMAGKSLYQSLRKNGRRS